jgi:hypothetical protein
MDQKVYAALASVLQYLEAEQVELQGKFVGLSLPILREYLAQQRGRALVKTYWLLDEGFPLQFKFPLGQILVTEGALELSHAAQYSLVALLSRHASGDSGECAASEKNRAYLSGWPVFSSYYLQADAKLWIITEGERRATTLLLPEEFDVLYASGELHLQPAASSGNGAYS